MGPDGVEARLGSQAALQGERSGRGGGRVLTSVLAVCEARAVAGQLQDVDVMGEPVEERAGQPFGAEDLGPFVEGRFEVTSVDACSSRWEKISNSRSAPVFDNGT